MDFSFQEKSAAISLLAVLGTYGYYFYFVLLGAGPVTSDEMLGWMVGLVVALIVIEVVFHILIAIVNPREAEARADEREKLIRLKAYRVSYVVLVTGVLSSLARLLFGSLVDPAAVTLLEIGNLLLLSLVVSEVAGYGTRLYQFRRDVH